MQLKRVLCSCLVFTALTYGQSISPDTARIPSFTAFDFPVGTGPQAIVTADFNGDGVPDLATANYYSNNISVLLNDRHGWFATRIDSDYFGLNPISLAVSDLNNDGKADLVVALLNSSSVAVALGNGDGTFGQRHDFGFYYNGVESVAVGDFNDFGGTGNKDIAPVNGGGISSGWGKVISVGVAAFGLPRQTPRVAQRLCH